MAWLFVFVDNVIGEPNQRIKKVRALFLNTTF